MVGPWGRGSDRAAATAKPSVRGNPNWWVILAVSLALMALLVATSGGRGGGRRTPTSAEIADHHLPGAKPTHGAPRPAATTTSTSAPISTTTSTTTTTTTTVTTTTRSSAAASHPTSGSVLTGTSAASTPPAVEPPTTTTTTAAQTPALAGGGTQTQGYLDPPLETSNQYGFTGTGNMVFSVVWSGDTFLTMAVSCPSGGNDVGGTSGMEASLPNVSGSCTATVTEPSSESATLTYTITWGPAGG